MGRFLAGVASALLLMTGGFFMWKAQADRGTLIPPLPAMAAATASLEGEPPTATEKTREEKRFARYDRNKDGAVARDEYLLSRQKAFAKLDTNGDGRLSFDEYAIKAATKFAAADRDRSGSLNAGEFATTRVVRKSAPRCACPQQAKPVQPPAEEPEES